MENTLEIITLILVVVGWPVTYGLAKRKEYQLELKKWEKDFLDNQLSKFYGLIYGILLENQRIWMSLKDQLGRDNVFRDNIPLTPEEEKLWVHYSENYFIPNNRKIVELIKYNIHYLNGVKFSINFLKFIDYSVRWELLHEQYKALGINYHSDTYGNFPRDFQKEIIQVVSDLKNRQWELVNDNNLDKKPAYNNI